MASCTKVAAFAAMLRVCQVALAPMEWTWQPVLGVIAGASMVIGSVIGITQTDMKRMLAYSSVAHAGFILLGVLAMSERGASATMFYLLTYGMATIGAFAILTVVRKGDGEASHVSDWAGLAKRSPVLAASMSLFLLSFAGIPLTAGFIGKLSVSPRPWSRGWVRWWCWPWSLLRSLRSSTCDRGGDVLRRSGDQHRRRRSRSRCLPRLFGSGRFGRIPGGGAGARAASRRDRCPFVVVPGAHRYRDCRRCHRYAGLGLFPGPVLDWLTVPLPLLS